MEGVDAVVLGLLVPGVVDAAAGDDSHVRVVPDIKVVVDHVSQTGLGHNHGDVDGLAPSPLFHGNLDALLVGERLNVNERGGAALDQLSVFADVKRSPRHAVDVGDAGKQVFVNLGQIHEYPF